MARIGIIGTGNISGIYLENAPRLGLEVLAVADLDLERARVQAEKYSVPHALSVDDLLAHPDIEIVLNLTVPAAHGPIALRALEAGKHVYNEKPLAITLEEAGKMLELSRQKGLRVGCAPDTFLGAGFQTARERLEGGLVGQAVQAHALMSSVGPEGWHPDPNFFFQPGAGPLFDMGPYYLTALVSLFGSVSSVFAANKSTHTQRTVGSGTKAGQRIAVNTPTHVSGILSFESGLTANLTMSFDAVAGRAPNLEVYGTAGSLTLPDPNTFGGPLETGDEHGTRRELALTKPFADNSRGLGLADMARAIQEGRPHLASLELSYHVLETMFRLLESGREGRSISVESRVIRPEALQDGFEQIKV